MSRLLMGLVALELVGCASWHATVLPGTVYADKAALTVLHPCRRQPGPIDSLWTPGNADISRLEHELLPYLHRREWLPPSGGEWQLTGDYAGFWSRGRRLIYASFRGASKDADAAALIGRPFPWCDGGSRFFGVVFDPADQTFDDLEINEQGQIRKPSDPLPLYPDPLNHP